MKKRIFTVVCIIVVAVVFFFLGYETKSGLDSSATHTEEKDIGLFDCFTSENVTQIEVYWLDGSYTIDKKDGIEEILNLLHSMKLEEVKPNDNDGDLVGVYMYTTNGECRCVDIWKNDIRFDGHFYVPQNDCFEKFVEIFNKQLPTQIGYGLNQ